MLETSIIVETPNNYLYPRDALLGSIFGCPDGTACNFRQTQVEITPHGFPVLDPNPISLDFHSFPNHKRKNIWMRCLAIETDVRGHLHYLFTAESVSFSPYLISLIMQVITSKSFPCMVGGTGLEPVTSCV